MKNSDDKPGPISKAPPPISPLRGGYSPARPPAGEKRPNWDYWRQIPKTELWKAVLLSCNAEPRSGAHAEFWNDRQRWGSDQKADSEYQDFLDRIDIAKAHIGSAGLAPAWINLGDALNSGVTLAQFSEWAMSMKWDIPVELAEMVTAMKLPEKSPPNAPKSEILGTKERTTLLTIIAALSRLAQLKIEEHPTKSAEAISKETEMLGARVAPRTIEEHLKATPEALERRTK